MSRVAGSEVEIRVGSEADIDILCAIDLDAAALYAQAGLDLMLPNDHEFSLAERSRWLWSLASRKTLVAVDESGSVVGFAATGVHDGEPYLDQLSVCRRVMRRGIGTMLLDAAEGMARDAGARVLWLTTYDHLPWNRPFYERAGFVVVPEADCKREILAELAYQRRWLPQPERRIVMRKTYRVGT